MVPLPEELLFCPPRFSCFSAHPFHSILSFLPASSYIPSSLLSYRSSTNSNFFPISSNILHQISYRPTHITISPHIFLAIPFSWTLPPLDLTSSLFLSLILFFIFISQIFPSQILLSSPLHSSNSLISPMYFLLLCILSISPNTLLYLFSLVYPKSLLLHILSHHLLWQEVVESSFVPLLRFWTDSKN